MGAHAHTPPLHGTGGSERFSSQVSAVLGSCSLLVFWPLWRRSSPSAAVGPSEEGWDSGSVVHLCSPRAFSRPC